MTKLATIEPAALDQDTNKYAQLFRIGDRVELIKAKWGLLGYSLPPLGTKATITNWVGGDACPQWLDVCWDGDPASYAKNWRDLLDGPRWSRMTLHCGIFQKVSAGDR